MPTVRQIDTNKYQDKGKGKETDVAKGAEMGVEWGKMVGKVIGRTSWYRLSSSSYMIYCTDGLFPFILFCGVSIGLVSYHVVQMKASKHHPIASTFKPPPSAPNHLPRKMILNPKTQIGRKTKTSRSRLKNQKREGTWKLDWSNAKTKDMKAAEAKEAKKKELMLRR